MAQSPAVWTTPQETELQTGSEYDLGAGFWRRPTLCRTSWLLSETMRRNQEAGCHGDVSVTMILLNFFGGKKVQTNHPRYCPPLKIRCLKVDVLFLIFFLPRFRLLQLFRIRTVPLNLHHLPPSSFLTSPEVWRVSPRCL